MADVLVPPQGLGPPHRKVMTTSVGDPRQEPRHDQPWLGGYVGLHLCCLLSTPSSWLQKELHVVRPVLGDVVSHHETTQH